MHGDIKPGNVIVRRSDGKPVLVDLGSARVAGQALLASSHVWEAPEAATETPLGIREYGC